jgi:glucan biosynthesis protein C
MGRAGGQNVSNTSDVRTSQALWNLRGVFILILVSFHSCMPYLVSTQGPPTAFNAPPYVWLTFPIADQRRFLGFDLYCAWEDVHMMAMMYFLSGVFVAPSLRRKGVGKFVADRTWRLGTPFLLSVFVLTPLAIYCVFHRLQPDASVAEYLAAYGRLPFLPNGPQWFLWLLLAFSWLAAAIYTFAPEAFDRLGAFAAGARRRPRPFLIGMALAAAIAYGPLAMAYGPFDWFERGPFSFQESRPLLYGVFFFAGISVGSVELGEGLLAADGALARGWRRFAVLGPLALLSWMGITGAVLAWPTFAPLTLGLLSALGYVAASVLGVMALLATTIRFCARPIRWLTPLARNSMGIFALHYAPMVWMQDALTGASAPAFVKASVVFVVTMSVSLGLALALRRSSALAWAIGEEPTPAAPAPQYARL